LTFGLKVFEHTSEHKNGTDKSAECETNMKQ